MRKHRIALITAMAAAACSDNSESTSDVAILDLAGAPSGVERLYGSTSTGRYGVPVAAGFDCDGDGQTDYAMSAMRASPLGRTDAGQVFLVFGNGQIGGTLDSGEQNPAILSVLGATLQENAGIEIWMDDLNGDGLGDLIVGRSNFSTADRVGAGALSVIFGSTELKALASRGEALDLDAPPSNIQITTFIGANALDRLGFWMRTADATGDGIADLLMSADQADRPGENNAGAAFLVRGGPTMTATHTVDLASFGTTALAGHVVRFEPPAGAQSFHFGATLALIDLDDNNRAEVLIAAALARVGGLLEAAGAPAGSGTRVGGNVGGSLFIFWDDVLTSSATWPAGLTVAFDDTPAPQRSRINGATLEDIFTSNNFGEELIGGVDYDGDDRPDLFVGDIRGDAPGRLDVGLGHVFFDASRLKGRNFDLDAVPADVRVSHIIGPSAGAISSDTSLQGDVDGDGLVDLVIASPLADPDGRRDAGAIHVLWGQSGPWPEMIDLADRPPNDVFLTTDIWGAQGATNAEDAGDTLMYSAVGADIDSDGRIDLIVNEMRGNGVLPGTIDVGNLIIVSGNSVPKPQ